MRPIWIAQPAELVLWAEVITAWIVMSYVVAPDGVAHRGARRDGSQIRIRIIAAGLMAGIVCWLLPPLGTDPALRWNLSVLATALTLAVAIARHAVSGSERGRRFLAEIEIGANALMSAGSGLAIGMTGGVGPPLGVWSSGRTAALTCIVGAVVFVFRGGTYIVRGLLNKAGVAPGSQDSKADRSKHPLDSAEFNRGRSIGNLERLLMIVVISLGSYEVLGFLIAAKGLIRSREFENRDFAEYFILGSLASAAVALVVGIVLRIGVTYFWNLPF